MLKHVTTFRKNRKKIMKKGGEVQKYPRGYLGGSSKCPRLSMRGGGGVKKVQKTVHMVCACPLTGYLKIEIAVTFRNAHGCKGAWNKKFSPKYVLSSCVGLVEMFRDV